MTSPLRLRPHQEECLTRAKEKNTIISLPTGEGKTLIAAKLVEHYLGLHSGKRVAFIVPTRPLVQQQSRYCVDHCLVRGAPPVVKKLVGDDQVAWKHADWDDMMACSHVVVCTPAVLHKALVTDKYISISVFSLIVFDECHNATGNSPMAAIMRDAVHPHVATTKGSAFPRILGLTASIIHGNLNNKEKKRRDLEALMNSTIFCPDVTQRLDHNNFVQLRSEPDPYHDSHKETIETHVNDAMETFGYMKEVTRVVLQCSHVFCELGTTSLLFYIEKVIVQQIRDKATHLELLKEEATSNLARNMTRCLPRLQQDLQQLSDRLSTALPATKVVHTRKLEQLLALLDTNFARHGYTGYRGIIFVEQIALVSALSKQINDKFRSRIQCGAVAGSGAQSETDRQEQLRAFKNGQAQILVATAALEEGIDVSECKFVVRYNYITTTKGHIQGAGRARHPEAEIYYFENSPEHELRKERDMSALARNTELELSRQEMDRAGSEMNLPVDQRHPYPFGSCTTEGEVNVYNCKQLLVEYCSRILGQSISPTVELYNYRTDPVSTRKIITSIRYPTPNGWQIKTEREYSAFWFAVDFEKVFPSERAKKKKAAQKEEMAFVYLVVVELRQRKLLDSHNNPTLIDRFGTKRKCPLRGDSSNDGIAVRNKVVQSTQHRSQLP